MKVVQMVILLANPKNQKVKYHEKNAKGLGKIPTHQLGEILSGF